MRRRSFAPFSSSRSLRANLGPLWPTVLAGGLVLAACGSSEGDDTPPLDEVDPGAGGSTMPGVGGTGTAAGGTAAGGSTGTGGILGAGGSTNTGGLDGAGGFIASGGAIGTGGDEGTGGVVASGGSANTGGSSSGGSSNGGAASADQCRPIGWVTRSGRTGGSVNVTGGGNAAPIVVTNYGDLERYAADGSPRVLYVDGNLGGGWSGTSGDRLEIKSNKTIIGIRPQTQLRAAIHVRDASNVILRNIVVRGPGSNSDQAWDNINIEGSSRNVWVDHSEFWDGQDGNADVVKGADNVSFTWSIFGYRTNGGHNFSNLVASSDNEPVSEGKLNITFMFNWFTGVAQRQPRCRYGNIHVVNNLFTRDGMTSQNGISAGVQCRVLIENNHFIGISDPIHRRDGGVSQLLGDNIFENTSGDSSGYGGTAFDPPYDYESFRVPAAQVEALIESRAGATLTSPTACKNY